MRWPLHPNLHRRRRARDSAPLVLNLILLLLSHQILKNIYIFLCVRVLEVIIWPNFIKWLEGSR